MYMYTPLGYCIYHKDRDNQGYNARKVISRCTHLLYCSKLSLGVNVNTRRVSTSDMGSIFHRKKSMKYSGHRNLLCELSKFNAFNFLGY